MKQGNFLITKKIKLLQSFTKAKLSQVEKHDQTHKEHQQKSMAKAMKSTNMRAQPK
jgi:hypothetical protein